MYRGPLGIDALHTRMRDVLCGSAERVLEGRFRIGEKVITTRGIPELQITNGTIFVIDSADDERSELRLETDLGDYVVLPYRECAVAARRVLHLGAQGAGDRGAGGDRLPAQLHAPQLLSRNLLYTAITRAQKLCILAGDDRAIARALRNTDATDRHSRLGERMASRHPARYHGYRGVPDAAGGERDEAEVGYQSVPRGSNSRRSRSRVSRVEPVARAVA